MEILIKVVRWLTVTFVIPASVIYYVLTAYMFKNASHSIFGYQFTTDTMTVILGSSVSVYLLLKGYLFYEDKVVEGRFKLMTKIYAEGDNVRDVIFVNDKVVYVEQGKNQLVVLHKKKRISEVNLLDVDSISIYQGGRLIGEKTSSTDRFVGKASVTTMKSLTLEIEYKQELNLAPIKIDFLKKSKMFNRKRLAKERLILVRDWYNTLGESCTFSSKNLTSHSSKGEIVL